MQTENACTNVFDTAQNTEQGIEQGIDQDTNQTQTQTSAQANTNRTQFGINSFDLAARREFGESLRIALACVDNKSANSENTTKAAPPNTTSLSQQLKAITSNTDSQLCRQIELLVQFDELEGWRETGAKHCVAWMGSELSIGRTLASERLRVGRQLRELPVLRALFRNGTLGWCKIRLLTRVADAHNERLLARAALDASVADVERLCEEYRWSKSEQQANNAGGEDAQALLRFSQRALHWRTLKSGNTELRLILPPELAQNLLKSLEHCEDELFNEQAELTEKPTATQRRADAAVMMAERALAYAGPDILKADRYQVVLTIDAESLAENVTTNYANEHEHEINPIPPRYPLIEQVGPIAVSTAQRLACDCRIMGVVSAAGEPVSIGRLTRLWPAPMRRAIIARDRHCQFPGCHATRSLTIHHIQNWMHGGETSVENAMCLCQAHHTLVHEGGYRISRGNAEARAFEFNSPHEHRTGTNYDTNYDTNYSSGKVTVNGNNQNIEDILRNDETLTSFAEELLPTRHRFSIQGPNDVAGKHMLTESATYKTASTTTAPTTTTALENRHQCNTKTVYARKQFWRLSG